MNSSQKVVGLLEGAVIGQRLNPNGNFANFCKAIVNKTAGLEGWGFSDEFKNRIGMDSENHSSTISPPTV